jgi:hypothetical protein
MEWLYPELKRINLKDRSSALQEAKASSFDAIDLVGIGIALFLAVVVTRYSATGLGALGRIRAALWNFMVAIPILLVFAEPFYVRRVRRGLREYLEKRSRSEADQTRQGHDFSKRLFDRRDPTYSVEELGVEMAILFRQLLKLRS